MRGDPPICSGLKRRNCVYPHARGSPSAERYLQYSDRLPRMRGSPATFVPSAALRCLPACAGIHPLYLVQVVWTGCLPMRGSTTRDTHCISDAVYPACAGIHLRCEGEHFGRVRLPRMRGDPPDSYKGGRWSEGSTPHARGSTLIGYYSVTVLHVYPACAGIHPLWNTDRH